MLNFLDNFLALDGGVRHQPQVLGDSISCDGQMPQHDRDAAPLAHRARAGPGDDNGISWNQKRMKKDEIRDTVTPPRKQTTKIKRHGNTAEKK